MICGVREVDLFEASSGDSKVVDDPRIDVAGEGGGLVWVVRDVHPRSLRILADGGRGEAGGEWQLCCCLGRGE